MGLDDLATFLLLLYRERCDVFVQNKSSLAIYMTKGRDTERDKVTLVF